MKNLLSSLLFSVAFITAIVAQAGPVNINTADADTLAAELNGIGPALARAIVEDRDRNGFYTTPEALTRVSGIGMRVVENNREFILVDVPSD